MCWRSWGTARIKSINSNRILGDHVKLEGGGLFSLLCPQARQQAGVGMIACFMCKSDLVPCGLGSCFVCKEAGVSGQL